MVQIIVAVLEDPKPINEIANMFGSEEMSQDEILVEVKNRVTTLVDRGMIELRGDQVRIRSEVRDKITSATDLSKIGPMIIQMLLKGQ